MRSVGPTSTSSTGRTPGMKEGGIIGHEFVGHVVAAGSGAGAHPEGTRVVGSFLIVCGACVPCRQRRFNHCTERRALGLGTLTGDLDGAQAERVRVPVADVNLAALTGAFSEVPDEQAIFCGDVLATGTYAAHLAEAGPGDTVVVIGAGPVGLLCAASVRALGCACHRPRRRSAPGRVRSRAYGSRSTRCVGSRCRRGRRGSNRWSYGRGDDRSGRTCLGVPIRDEDDGERRQGGDRGRVRLRALRATDGDGVDPGARSPVLGDGQRPGPLDRRADPGGLGSDRSDRDRHPPVAARGRGRGLPDCSREREAIKVLLEVKS